MIKSILTTLSLLTISTVPALASITRVDNNTFVATDASNQSHIIQYQRTDHEGDVQVKVTVGNAIVYYWVNCREDRISIGGDAFNGWDYVDHEKMEGYYSDVACRRV